MSPRKQAIREMVDRQAPERDDWIARSSYFHKEDRRYMNFLIPEGAQVLELGCGTGQLLHSLRPSRGVGVDFSEKMIEIARSKYPGIEFRVGDIEDERTIQELEGPFDYVVLSDIVGYLEDCEAALANVHKICMPNTRIIVAYYSKLWEPVLRLAELLGAKMPQVEQNWLSAEDITNVLHLADFEVIKSEWRQLLPKRLLGIGRLINRFIGTLPIIRRACLRDYVVARPMRNIELGKPSTSVIIPCRNEHGNIENAVKRLPQFCDDLEVIFVEGNSRDNTLEECYRVRDAYPDVDIRVLQQSGVGKGDAARLGFTEARGEILMILDADLTVPPESLPKFYRAIVCGKGNFINGTRMVYPLEEGAMRFLNFLANRIFSYVFSWLLNQRFTDTLCGTKVLLREHYDQIAANRAYFGDFDPFGDFDLIFGASKLNLKIIEIPVRYAPREYGATQISRFRHGWSLVRMAALAYRKLKAF